MDIALFSMFVINKTSKLHYTVAGSGPQPLLLFHGFGQDHKVFKSLTEVLEHRYTLYSFDLYFHGQSSWNLDEQPLEKSVWKQTMLQFLAENKLENFSLAGFSMGGKFVLATLEAFPKQTKEIFLLAPDGIKTSFWYSLATYPIVLRKVFRSMVHHPKRFNSLVRVLQQLNLLNNGLGKFAEHQMNSEEKRIKVYYSWVVFRHLKFNLDHLCNLINEYQVATTLLVGKYDMVIKANEMNRFLKKVKKYHLEIIETGHNGLLSKSVEFFRQHYNSC